MARAIKFQLGRVVSWRNRFLCDCVTINDKWLNATFKEDIKPLFQVLYYFSVKISFTFLLLPSEWGFFVLSFLFKPNPEPVIFITFSSSLTFALLKRFLKITPTGCSGSLLSISVIITEPVFSATFPTVFAPEYKKVITKRNSPLKKDHITIPLCILKLDQ